ncbi:mechanosensitive ion channel family protein [Limnovirga soli]|uniref:Mechanosensitive ion channel n=1 Tax=Limnovirga soli TaxID=2656915 RepID=A0A8J8JSX6_9BACT|nr:mechanosensitive ion channel domain-containing protein [Limnovirga soli]NNV55263.1 mechanosensitive ion channel [Limnovirga soli]
MGRVKRIFLLTFFAVVACGLNAFAQQQEITDTSKPIVDTPKAVKKATHANKRSDTAVSGLLQKIEIVTAVINDANNLLERGFDTLDISDGLPDVEAIISTYSQSGNEKLESFRSLKASKSILLETTYKLKKWQASLAEMSHNLAEIHDRLHVLSRDSSWLVMPEDSVLRELYIYQLGSIVQKWKSCDSANKQCVLRIGILQNRVSSTYLNTDAALTKVNYQIEHFQKRLWRPEEPSIWKANEINTPRSFFEVITISLQGMQKVIGAYLSTNSSHTIGGFVCILLLFGWFVFNMKRIRNYNENSKAVLSNLVIIQLNPFLAAAVFVITFLPFTYLHPPPSFITLQWSLLAIVYTVLIWKTFLHWFRKYWITFVLLFLSVSFMNIIYFTTIAERWLQLLLVVAAIIMGIITFIKLENPGRELPRYARPVLIFFIAQMSCALVANLFGCYILSKFFASSAVYSILSAQALYACVQIVVEAIYLQFEAYNKVSFFVSYFNFHAIRQNLLKGLNTVAIIAWLIILFSNLNLYDTIAETVKDFLTEERTVGNTTFNFQSIVIFLLVIWVASFLSKLIVLLFDHNTAGGSIKRNKWGSALLLIRLGIFSLGILFAFAASGIPMDKLTIIIGALGVGIGFGLQNIVNNLVSGIIIAFEKPIHIGDSIEVGGRYGTIKEIGIRSSKMSTVEGSDVIIPNGDLLSQHIVNWTLSSQFRRVEILVGVSYSSNLRQVEDILKQIVFNQEGIEKNPSSLILAHEFADSAVNFRMLFWCDNNNFIVIKSQVLIQVHEAFKQHNIEIPFPQTDVHLRSDIPVLAPDKDATDNQSSKKEISTKPAKE